MIKYTLYFPNTKASPWPAQGALHNDSVVPLSKFISQDRRPRSARLREVTGLSVLGPPPPCTPPLTMQQEGGALPPSPGAGAEFSWAGGSGQPTGCQDAEPRGCSGHRCTSKSGWGQTDKSAAESYHLP